jgi:hypothetical protein
MLNAVPEAAGEVTLGEGAREAQRVVRASGYAGQVNVDAGARRADRRLTGGAEGVEGHRRRVGAEVVAAEIGQAQLHAAAESDVGAGAGTGHVDDERVHLVTVLAAVEPGAGPERHVLRKVRRLDFAVQLLDVNGGRDAARRGRRVAVADAAVVEVRHEVDVVLGVVSLADPVREHELAVVIALVAETILPLGTGGLVTGPVMTLRRTFRSTGTEISAVEREPFRVRGAGSKQCSGDGERQ